jgi:hypothetical protein
MVTTEASSKIAGYNFQFQRALYRLFSSESAETTVGIETDDDVVEITRDANGLVQIVFEQDKHSVQDSGHPFQDSSKNLWHTMHIWLDSMDSVRQKYQNVSYCLVTNKEVPIRAFATKLGTAKEKSEIDECIKEIRQRATEATSDGATSIKAVAAFSDEHLHFLIENLKLMDEFATASGADPREATIQLFQLPPDLHNKGSDIYNSILGLLVDICQTAWINKQPTWIDKAAYTKRLHSEIAAHRMKRFVDRPLMSTTYQELLNRNGDDHLFLRQLQRLGVDNKVCDHALSHYWGFYAERVRLQAEGDVLPTAWEERNALLHQRWQMMGDSTKLEADSGTTEEVLDKKILAKTLDGNYTAKLGLHDTSQPYFTSGNYHDLANQPEHTCFIHWHSSFAPKNKNGEKK